MTAAPTIGHLVERLPRRRLGWSDASEHALAQAFGLMPRIVAAQAARLPGGGCGWTVGRAGLTGTGMAIALLTRGDAEPKVVVKLPISAQAAAALEREGDVLSAVWRDERLTEWRKLMPRPYAGGEVLGQPYRIDSALGGAVAPRTLDQSALLRAQRAAAAAIDPLHRATARRVVVDRGLAERWIDAPLESAFGRAWMSHSTAGELDVLRRELHAAVDGLELSASWIHGDYWLGNVLFAPDDHTVTGIVDWEGAAPVDLPVHDILHLLLYGRRLRTGEELGVIIHRRLAGEAWSPAEAELLALYGSWSHDGALTDRHVLLLYWLRHVGLHLGQQGDARGVRRRLWETRNVQRVLAAL